MPEALYRVRLKTCSHELTLTITTRSRADNIGHIGPAPIQEGVPKILIGGYSPAAISRVGRWGDGFISGRGDPKVAASAFKLAQDSWKANGRQGKPRLVCATYFALGDHSREDGVLYLRDYYSFAGALAENMANHLLSIPDEVKVVTDTFSSIGADELIMWPCVPKSVSLISYQNCLRKKPKQIT